MLFSHEVLIHAFRQDKIVSEYAGEYILAFLPSILIFSQVDINSRFLNHLESSHKPMIIILTISCLIHAGITYVLVVVYEASILGIAVSNGISNLLILAMQFLYVNCLYTNHDISF